MSEYLDMHDPSDWAACLCDYFQEEFNSYRWYPKQKLLVINQTLLSDIWYTGTNEPLTYENLKRAAFRVARLRFPDVKNVRISFSEDFRR